MNTSKSIFLSVTTFCYTGLALADDRQQDHHESHFYEDEIVVSAPFQGSEAETALPINLLTGEMLQRQVEGEIGATLRNQIGIHNTSFGPSVGQAVIRGQSGNRVQILQNSVNNIDASSVSPDHTNGVEPALASRIEVIRGPATLLYGNGAIGGIVNVIDERIIEATIERPEFIIEQRHDTVNEGNSTVAKFNGSFGSINLHLDAFSSDNNDVEVKGFAIDEAALELLEDAHDGEGHDDGEHEEEEITNSKGYIANSDAESKGYTAGTSISGDKGFIGFSVSSMDNNYGLPGGTHGHHEEEHGEDHDEEHDEEHGEEEGEEEGEEFVRIDMEQTRYDIRGEYRPDGGFIERLQASVNYTDYEHSELEIEPDGTSVIGTQFSNEGYAGRVTINHAPIGRLNGIWGAQFSNTEFSASGEEAFIPKTDSTGIAIFAIERLKAAGMHWEFGYRYESRETDPGGSCDRDEDTRSLSASVLYDLNKDSNIMISLSSSQRAPTLEERYSNVKANGCAAPSDPEEFVAHAATGLLEVGDPDLGKEEATNIELGFRQHNGPITGEFSVFYNEIKDFIYLEDIGEFEEQTIASYVAEDATFYGAEGRLTFQAFQSERGELDISFQGDLVKANLDDRGDVPRIPPARFGVGFSWHAPAWSADLNITKVMDQKDTGIGELRTDGYTMLDAYADYHFNLGSSELLIFAKGSNLLDEEVRNHTSFLKNFAPEPGRGFRVGVRYTY